MKQLSGLDVSFLHMETGRAFGHVSSLSVYRPPTDDYDPYEALRSQIESKLGVLEPLRRRLVEVPLGLDRPYWINDPDFDLDFHLRHVAVPGGGGEQAIGDLIGRLIGRQLDRSRPLWEAYVIEGLPGGDFGVLFKLHHATIDGAAGAQMMAIINADSPDVVPPPLAENPDAAWSSEREPSSAELLTRTASEFAKVPAKGLRLQVKLLNEAGRITRNRGFNAAANSIRRGLPGPAGDLVSKVIGSEIALDDDQPPILPQIGGPRTPFNATITPHRRFAYRSTSLTNIKALKNAMGVTINDVVMTVCAGALRRYLESHDALPDDNLVAMVPVSIRDGSETEVWSNRVSAIFAELPTATADPLERVAAMRESMVTAKGQFDLLPADMLLEMADLAPPALAVRAARVAARTRISDRTNPPANVVISNVPGPRSPLYLQGAELKHYFPVSTVADGVGLNITVQSYCDVLDFGLVSCRELVPDLWQLMEMLLEEIELMAEAVGVALPDPVDVGAIARRENGQDANRSRSKAPATKRGAAKAKSASKKKAAAKKKATPKKKATTKKKS